MLSLKFKTAKYEDGHLCLAADNPAAARQFVRATKSDKMYQADIKQYREKRSLDANAYCWVLIDKIAAATGVPARDVYRDIIRDVGGNSYIVPIRLDAVERYIQVWQSNGLAWMCDNLGDCKHTHGYVNIKCYYGSSVYDTNQMSRLIDLVVQECKQLGIETLPPDKLAALKEAWNE